MKEWFESVWDVDPRTTGGILTRTVKGPGTDQCEAMYKGTITAGYDVSWQMLVLLT